MVFWLYSSYKCTNLKISIRYTFSCVITFIDFYIILSKELSFNIKSFNFPAIFYKKKSGMIDLFPAL